MWFPSSRTAIVLAIGVVAVLLTALTSGALTTTQQLPSSGTLTSANVNIYCEQTCINRADSVEWGFLDPGDTTTEKIYIQNNGTVPLTLSMRTINWEPQSAASSIALEWNRENAILNIGQVIEATLTLTIEADVPEDITSFSFDIIISGVEQ